MDWLSFVQTNWRLLRHKFSRKRDYFHPVVYGRSAKLALYGVSTARAMPLHGSNAQLHLPAAWHPDDSEPSRLGLIDADGASVRSTPGVRKSQKQLIATVNSGARKKKRKGHLTSSKSMM